MSNEVDGSLSLDDASVPSMPVDSADSDVPASVISLGDTIVSGNDSIGDRQTSSPDDRRQRMSADDAISQLAFTEERRKGARRSMRLSLLHRLPSIEASFRSEFGPASSEFSAVRRFCAATCLMIEEVSAADED